MNELFLVKRVTPLNFVNYYIFLFIITGITPNIPRPSTNEIIDFFSLVLGNNS